MSFNVNDHTFQILDLQLNVGRYGHGCAMIPNTNKIMITGGFSYARHLNSTEIIDMEDGTIAMGSPMNSKRCHHGIGVVTINNEDRLFVFGGEDKWYGIVASVEVYDVKTERWETTGSKLNKEKSDFGFLTVNLAQIQNLWMYFISQSNLKVFSFLSESAK